MAIDASRRGFITGAVAALVAAPAIVSAGSLMQLRGEPLYAGRNSLLTIDMITREAVQMFKNSNEFLRRIDEQYDGAFAIEGAKIGSKLRVRLPNDYLVYNKEFRTLVPRQRMYNYAKSREVEAASLISNASEFPGFKGLKTQVPAALAVAGGVALAVSKNPVVSRRFWSSK